MNGKLALEFCHLLKWDLVTKHVRFWGQSGHDLLRCTCLLLTQSGHPAAPSDYT